VKREKNESQKKRGQQKTNDGQNKKKSPQELGNPSSETSLMRQGVRNYKEHKKDKKNYLLPTRTGGGLGERRVRAPYRREPHGCKTK